MTTEKKEKIDCITFYNIISEYHDKQLKQHDSELFEKHFADCKLCHNFFNSFIDTMKMVEGPVRSKYNEITMPDAVREKMINFLIERQQKG